MPIDIKSKFIDPEMATDQELYQGLSTKADTTYVDTEIEIEAAARVAVSNRVEDIENDYGVAGGLATLDGAGKVPAAMLPGTVLEYKGTWNATTNTPTLQNGSVANSAADAGHIYRVSVAGTVNFGAGNITFYVGDDVILSESLLWERSPGGNLIVSVNGFQGDVVLKSENISMTTPVASGSDVQHALENVYSSVSSTMADHIASADPHTQYETIAEAQAKVDAHANLTNNPHAVTKAQVGLSNVSNLTPADLPISTATQSALDLKYDSSNPNGYVNAAAAAVAAPVQSVAGRTGAVVLTKSDVGLSSVDNVSAASLRDRSTHTGTQLASTISDFTTAVQAVTIDAAKIDGGVVSNAEFATLDGITTGVSIQSQIDGKQATITGAATTITGSNLTISRALASDASGKVSVSATTASELGFVSGVTSAIQTQLNAKQATGNYITALTGDATASGPGSATLTLANSGVTAGTYDNVTVDAKGRVTLGTQTIWKYKTTAIQSTTAASFAAITELTSIALPVGLYRFSCFAIAQTAATTTGIGLRTGAGTATISTINSKWRIGQAADGTAKDFVVDQLAANTNVTSGSAIAANTNFNIVGDGVFRITVAGTVRIEFRTEVANSAATVQPDSVWIIESI